MLLSGPQLEPGGQESLLDHPSPSPPSSPLDTYQLQGLAGAAAQGSLGNAQRMSKQHQLLRVAQVVGGTLGTGRIVSAGNLIRPGCSSPSLWSSPPSMSCQASQPHSLLHLHPGQTLQHCPQEVPFPRLLPSPPQLHFFLPFPCVSPLPCPLLMVSPVTPHPCPPLWVLSPLNPLWQHPCPLPVSRPASLTHQLLLQHHTIGLDLPHLL